MSHHKRMNTVRTGLTACVATLIAACSANSPMPERAPVTETRSGVTTVQSSTSVKTQTATPVVGPGQYVVIKGDTLYSLSKKLGIPMQKLADLNQLKVPYTLQVGQLLQTAMASSSTTNSGDATSKAVNEDAEVVTAAIPMPGAVVSARPAAEATPPAQTSTAKPAVLPAAADSNTIEEIGDSTLQWQWPVQGKLMQGYDPSNNKGLNLTVNTGLSIVAAAAGKVIYSGPDVRGNGKLVIVKHTVNLLSVYAHNGNATVKEGSMVSMGEPLATPQTAGAALTVHFEIRQRGKPVDPAKYLPATMPR